MGDMIEDFKFLKEVKKEEKAKTFDESMQFLADNNVPYDSHNNGLHLIVADKYDFYPSTQLFKSRKRNKKGKFVKDYGASEFVLRLKHEGVI